MARSLPSLVVEEVLLLVTSRDAAAAVLAIPEWAPVLRSASFRKRHRARFERIEFHLPLDVAQEWGEEPETDDEEDEVHGPFNICQTTWGKTPSNHCVACLINPYLLTQPLEVSHCTCADHLFLFAGRDHIVWGDVFWWEGLNSEEWPTCWGYKCLDTPTTRQRLRRRVEQQRQRRQHSAE